MLTFSPLFLYLWLAVFCIPHSIVILWTSPTLVWTQERQLWTWISHPSSSWWEHFLLFRFCKFAVSARFDLFIPSKHIPQSIWRTTTFSFFSDNFYELQNWSSILYLEWLSFLLMSLWLHGTFSLNLRTPVSCACLLIELLSELFHICRYRCN